MLSTTDYLPALFTHIEQYISLGEKERHLLTNVVNDEVVAHAQFLHTILHREDYI